MGKIITGPVINHGNNSGINPEINFGMNPEKHPEHNTTTNPGSNNEMDEALHSGSNATVNTVMNPGSNDAMDAAVHSGSNAAVNTVMNPGSNDAMDAAVHSGSNAAWNSGMELRYTHKWYYLEEFLRCGTNIRHWIYSAEGDLVDCNADDVSFNQIFIYTQCLSQMLEHFRTSGNPVLLSTVLGIEWAAALCPGRGMIPDRIHVIGPVLNTDFNPTLYRAELGPYKVPKEYRGHLMELLKSLPTVPTSLFFNYILMLQYTATGEHLERKDIVPLGSSPDASQTETEDPKTAAEKKRNRMQVWLAEKALLDNVRTGNLNYHNQMNQASTISSGVNSQSGPLSQARISVIVFSSLCSRAAIDGGLSPELAYSIGDRYIHETTRVTSVSELQAIADRMYQEFIRMVHDHRSRQNLHSQVRACMDYIDANPEEEISLADLAKRLNYTEYYLSRKFRQEVGCSVNEYMHRARTERAKLLLDATTMPVYEIAAQLHYSSATHFSDTFRKLTGMHPSEYRRQNQRV